MRLRFARFPHQRGDEKVEIPHHRGFILRLGAARFVNSFEGGFQCSAVTRVMDRCEVGKGELCGEFVGAGAIKPNPTVFPRLLCIGLVDNKLARLDKKQIAGL